MISKWINVKDNLPDEPGDYLAFVKYSNPKETECVAGCEIVYYDIFKPYTTMTEAGEWLFDGCTADKSIVLYWMPLPESPEPTNEV